MEKIRTRFAPSPTGQMHIGSLRTALFAFVMAKHESGRFILRIEDTDKKREVKGGVEKITTILQVFGLKWDEYYVQSERLEKYQEAAQKLVRGGYAFYCQCKAKNAKEEGFSTLLRDPCRDKHLIKGAVKLKVPDKEKIAFVDFILNKEVAWETEAVADTTLLKSDGFPTYHLAVVVDDNDMNITHVLRGHDWLPSTPVHLLVYRYLNLKLPKIGHLTDILDPNGGKLSKRKGSVSCQVLLKEGYLPEAILNFIMLLGWAPKDNREFFSLEEFVEQFDIGGLQKANPVFDRVKLDWFNGEYIRKLSLNEFKTKLKEQNGQFNKLEEEKQLAISKLIRERISTLQDFDCLAGFFFAAPKVDKVLFGPNHIKHLKAAKEAILEISWELGEINTKLALVIKENDFKTGDFFMDLRIALTGSKFTPPINESMVILGKDETLERINSCL